MRVRPLSRNSSTSSGSVTATGTATISDLGMATSSARIRRSAPSAGAEGPGGGRRGRGGRGGGGGGLGGAVLVRRAQRVDEPREQTATGALGGVALVVAAG